MKLFSWLIIFGLLYLLYLNASPEIKLKVDSSVAGIKNMIFKSNTTNIEDTGQAISPPPTIYQPTPDGERTILGPVYQEVQCVSDNECKEWYKCQDCACDITQGICYYD